MRLHRRLLLGAVIGGFVLSLIVIAGMALRGAPRGRIAAGVSVAGRDLSGLSLPEARARLELWGAERLADPVSVRLDLGDAHKWWNPTRADLGAKIDVAWTLDRAAQAGRPRGLGSRLIRLLRGAPKVEIEPKWDFDPAAGRRYLLRTAQPVSDLRPRNARFLPSGSSFRIAPEQTGRALDMDASISALARAAISLSDPHADLVTRELKPRITAADLKSIRREIARFTTSYSERGSRARNIGVACNRINGSIVMPGERFSYNRTVGPRDARFGFRRAPVIVEGKLVPGMGGGVCQVSTTLYNAALLANLKIVRRSHHAFPVHYVPAGRDATVDYGSIDFQFQNSGRTPIAIAASGSGGRVQMRIFGRADAQEKVSIERTSLGRIERPVKVVRLPTAPLGRRLVLDPGRTGHRVTTWRIVRAAGGSARRERVSRDEYPAFPRVIGVGSRAAPNRLSGDHAD